MVKGSIEVRKGSAGFDTVVRAEGIQQVESTRHKLWDRILGLIQRDLDERRSRKLFVEVRDESGLCEKEIGELSTEERLSLHPILREYVAESLVDRYLAQRGHVDLIERRRPYTKEIGDLTPEDLPALIEADRLRVEEEDQRGRDQAEFVRETRADLGRLSVIEPAMTETGEKVRR